MARPRNTDPSRLIRPIIEDLAREIARVVVAGTINRAQQAVRATASTANGVSTLPSAKRQSPRLCYYPGCKNVAAPRFGMFCAAEHKNLPASTKAKYRNARAAEARV